MKIVIFLACALLLMAALAAAMRVLREQAARRAPLPSRLPTVKLKSAKTYPASVGMPMRPRNFRSAGPAQPASPDNVGKVMSSEFFDPTGSVASPGV